MKDIKDLKIVFIDDHCPMCTKCTEWLIEKDRQRVLMFSSNRSIVFNKLRGNSDQQIKDEIYFYSNGKFSSGFEAIIEILNELNIYQGLNILLKLTPNLFGRICYRIIARLRIRKSLVCNLKLIDKNKERFLN